MWDPIRGLTLADISHSYDPGPSLFNAMQDVKQSQLTDIATRKAMALDKINRTKFSSDDDKLAALEEAGLTDEAEKLRGLIGAKKFQEEAKAGVVEGKRDAVPEQSERAKVFGPYQDPNVYSNPANGYSQGNGGSPFMQPVSLSDASKGLIPSVDVAPGTGADVTQQYRPAQAASPGVRRDMTSMELGNAALRDIPINANNVDNIIKAAKEREIAAKENQATRMQGLLDGVEQNFTQSPDYQALQSRITSSAPGDLATTAYKANLELRQKLTAFAQRYQVPADAIDKMYKNLQFSQGPSDQGAGFENAAKIQAGQADKQINNQNLQNLQKVDYEMWVGGQSGSGLSGAISNYDSIVNKLSSGNPAIIAEGVIALRKLKDSSQVTSHEFDQAMDQLIPTIPDKISNEFKKQLSGQLDPKVGSRLKILLDDALRSKFQTYEETIQTSMQNGQYPNYTMLGRKSMDRMFKKNPGLRPEADGL